MNMTAEKTVRELALENTAATRVFEELGIDYCCGGNKSLEDACRASNLSVDQVIDSLEMAEEAAYTTQKDRNWQIEPTREFVVSVLDVSWKLEWFIPRQPRTPNKTVPGKRRRSRTAFRFAFPCSLRRRNGCASISGRAAISNASTVIAGGLLEKQILSRRGG
jgi:hypothetical protein